MSEQIPTDPVMPEHLLCRACSRYPHDVGCPVWRKMSHSDRLLEASLARSSAGASAKFSGCVTCGSTDYPHECSPPEPGGDGPGEEDGIWSSGFLKRCGLDMTVGKVIALYQNASSLCARIGMEGEVDSRDSWVRGTMEALREIDGGIHRNIKLPETKVEKP